MGKCRRPVFSCGVRSAQEVIASSKPICTARSRHCEPVSEAQECPAEADGPFLVPYAPMLHTTIRMSNPPELTAPARGRTARLSLASLDLNRRSAGSSASRRCWGALAALRLVTQGRAYDLGLPYDRNSYKWPGHSPGEVISFRSPQGDLPFTTPKAATRV